VETLEEAQQVLAGTDHSWLLILDNADDPNFDYQTYFPPGTSGIILMTSRNPDCCQYATLGSENLEGLDPEEAVCLLLRTAKVPSDQWHVRHVQARVVTDLLGSHPLALIQAGSYVGRGHCTLRQYPQVFQRQRKRLLQFRPQQARSRYEHIYATFDASAQVLESAGDQTAQDALQLLSTLSMLSTEEMPIAIFEAAWQGAHNVSRSTIETDNVNKSLAMARFSATVLYRNDSGGTGLISGSRSHSFADIISFDRGEQSTWFDDYIDTRFDPCLDA
jgi:hypothetical protein